MGMRMLRICQHCGTKTTNTNTYCWNCGRDVDGFLKYPSRAEVERIIQGMIRGEITMGPPVDYIARIAMVDAKTKCRKCGELLTDIHNIGGGKREPLPEHKQCPDKINVQLLVVDLGESCVVKCEAGRFERDIDGFKYIASTGSTVHIRHPFKRLREAIDARHDKPPVPRIEQESGGGHELHFNSNGIEPQKTYIGPNARSALESIFEKPMPIYVPKKGEWVQLPDTSEIPHRSLNDAVWDRGWTDAIALIPFKVWRYTLKG